MSIPAAWHPDPLGRHQYRYWDGGRWTEHVADQGVAGIDGLEPAAPDHRDAGEVADAGDPGMATTTGDRPHWQEPWIEVSAPAAAAAGGDPTAAGGDPDHWRQPWDEAPVGQVAVADPSVARSDEGSYWQHPWEGSPAADPATTEDTTPLPIPDPVPGPLPDPVPGPLPDPGPGPEPRPAPEPEPTPEPTPSPEPVPDPTAMDPSADDQALPHWQRPWATATGADT